MSEITKACPDCAKRDGTIHFDKHCKLCNDSGRVPDVEATLRAEVARLTEERDYLKGECDAFNAQVKRMGAGMQEEHQAHQAEVARLTATLAERDATIAGLMVSVESLTHMNAVATDALTARDDSHRELTQALTAHHESQIAERDGEVARLTGTLAPVRIMHAECPECGANPTAIITAFRVVTRVTVEFAYEPQNGDLDLTQAGLRQIIGPEDETQMTLACSAGHEWKGHSAT